MLEVESSHVRSSISSDGLFPIKVCIFDMLVDMFAWLPYGGEGRKDIPQL